MTVDVHGNSIAQIKRFLYRWKLFEVVSLNFNIAIVFVLLFLAVNTQLGLHKGKFTRGKLKPNHFEWPRLKIRETEKRRPTKKISVWFELKIDEQKASRIKEDEERTWKESFELGNFEYDS